MIPEGATHQGVTTGRFYKFDSKTETFSWWRGDGRWFGANIVEFKMEPHLYKPLAGPPTLVCVEPVAVSRPWAQPKPALPGLLTVATESKRFVWGAKL